nr:PREDICTED: glucose-dependent insulinotropic receptor-like [Balearica regulorum gibbericeps]
MVSLLYVVLHSLLSCLILPANLLVIMAVYQLMRKHPGTSYVYILNLATANLLVGVMCNAEVLDDILDRDFDRSKSFCLLHVTMSMTPCAGSILTLLLISLDSYLVVMLLLSYPTLLKKMPSEYLYAICFGIFAPSLRVLVCLHVSVSSITYVQHTWLRHACTQTAPLCAHPCHFKALRTMLIIFVSFSLSWSPYLVEGTMQAACSSCNLAKDTL